MDTEAYTVLLYLGLFIVIGLGFMTWVITRKEKQ
jgi:hypothetical protein